MLISVVMAVFNGEKGVGHAIESVLNQSFEDFEFIIIDDGSTDRSYEIITNYAKRDKRIRIFKNKINSGLTKSLNHMVKLAKGKYIARQDDDDISHMDRLRKQLNFLESNPDYAFCGCNVKLKDHNSIYVKYFNYETIHKNQIVENCFVHPTILIKKRVFERFGYYNEKLKYGQDFELWCRLLYKFKLKAKNLKEKLLILDNPINKISDKNKQKLTIQMKNQIFTTLLYLKYTKNKFRGIISIIFLLTRILYIKIFLKP